jgi:Zn-dependent protease with chaperone function
MNGRKNGDRRRRDVELAAVTAFVPVLAVVPVWLLAIVVIWWPISLVSSITFWQVALIHLAVGSVLFVPAAQRQLLTRMIGARKPTADEAPKLQRAFNEVVQAWHLRKHHFAVGVVDDDDLNAFACGGHLVVVTSYAVRTLEHDELCGVLAHELCHHLGSHTIALTINQWLVAPVVMLARVGSYLRNVSIAATDAFGRGNDYVRIFGRAVAGSFSFMAWIFGSGFMVARWLTNLFGKSAEYSADRRVVAMGYGRQLAAALRRTPRVDATTHPPARTRVARIEAILRPRWGKHPSRGL